MYLTSDFKKQIIDRYSHGWAEWRRWLELAHPVSDDKWLTRATVSPPDPAETDKEDPYRLSPRRRSRYL